MLRQSFASAFREQRLIGRLLGTFGNNIGGYAKDTGHTYIGDPLDKGNYGKAALGAGLAVGSVAFESFDYALAGFIGKPLSPPGPGLFPRIRRDTRELVSDIVHLKPFSVAADFVRIVPGSIVMDLGEAAIGGVEHTGPRHVASSARSQSAALFNTKWPRPR